MIKYIRFLTLATFIALLAFDDAVSSESRFDEAVNSDRWSEIGFCYRPQPGSMVKDPPQSLSSGGKLSTTLYAHNSGEGPYSNPPNYNYRFCFLEDNDGNRQSPVLRVNPGDLIHLKVVNQMRDKQGFPEPMVHLFGTNLCIPNQNIDNISIATTNVHFHGSDIPPICGADNVISTIIQPDDGTPGNISNFNYKFRAWGRISPGLYWYHPHIHGIADQQVLGGMSGVIVIEGMEKFYPEVQDIRERILILRDLDKVNPATLENPPEDEPFKNVSVNYVPIIYGNDKIPSIEMGANERQFWRVANASSDTQFILNFQFYQADAEGAFSWQTQKIELIGKDGAPIIPNNGNGKMITQLVLPSGSRAEFIVTAPPAGTPARWYSEDYNAFVKTFVPDCAPDFPSSSCDSSDRTPARVISNIIMTTAPSLTTSAAKLSKVQTVDSSAPDELQHWYDSVINAIVSKERTLYYTKNPGKNPADYFFTVDGQIPQVFGSQSTPNIVIQGPTIEDWYIENRDNESHIFHIHQLHFIPLLTNGQHIPPNPPPGFIDFPFIEDSMVVNPCRQWKSGIDPSTDPYGLKFPLGSPLNDSEFTGKNCLLPTVQKIRMDFRDQNIAGKIIYHCHILLHEDAGMMGVLQLNF